MCSEITDNKFWRGKFLILLHIVNSYLDNNVSYPYEDFLFLCVRKRRVFKRGLRKYFPFFFFFCARKYSRIIYYV